MLLSINASTARCAVVTSQGRSFSPTSCAHPWVASPGQPLASRTASASASAPRIIPLQVHRDVSTRPLPWWQGIVLPPSLVQPGGGVGRVGRLPVRIIPVPPGARQYQLHVHGWPPAAAQHRLAEGLFRGGPVLVSRVDLIERLKTGVSITLST